MDIHEPDEPRMRFDLEQTNHLILLAILPVLVHGALATDLQPVFITPIDLNSTGSSTANSFKQMMVENDNGIFLVYNWKDYRYQYGNWNLLRSTDEGKTFTIVYAPHPGGWYLHPAVETDEEDNLHLILSDMDATDTPFYYYRFLAERDYRDPLITKIPGDRTGKFSAFYEEETHRMFLFNDQGILTILNATTGERIARKMVAYGGGPHAAIMYPHIYMEEGAIYHAWTTQLHSHYLYWDIHFAWSPDDGVTWRKADGTTLETPFVPDDTGPTDNVVLAEELEYNAWLNSLVHKDGKVHFAYFSDLGKRHWVYVRMDLKTGKIDRRTEPRGETTTLCGNGGFFATSPGQPLYMISTNGTHILALVSYDNGDSWHDAAVSQKAFDYVKYVSGSRKTSSLGIIGSFTAYNRTTRLNEAYFFRIPLVEEEPEEPVYGFQYNLKPSRISILRGESEITRITVAPTDSFHEEVHLEASPPQSLAISFVPPSGEPPFSSMIRINTSGSTATGLYEVPVVASSGGVNESFLLEVEVFTPPPGPDFEIAVVPSIITVAQSQSTDANATITPIRGFSDYSSLSVTDMPLGLAASFDPSWGKSQYVSRVTVSAQADLLPGTYAINITGKGGGNTHACMLFVTVTASVPERALCTLLALLALWILILYHNGSYVGRRTDPSAPRRLPHR